MPSISTGSSAANPPRQAAILTTKSPDRLTPEQRSLLDRLSISCPELLWMRTLALDFRDALASNDGQQMRCWIHGAKQCGIGSLVRFAFGLQKDLSAVLAAVETPWSNGQVGSDQSSQDHQAPDVWPGGLPFVTGWHPSIRTARSTCCPKGTLSCTKMAEEQISTGVDTSNPGCPKRLVFASVHCTV